MNTPVSFKISKLLKDIGFDLKTTAYYSGLNIHLDEVRFDYNDKTIESPTHKGNGGLFSAPSIAEVVMWLYEKHGIWIDVSLNQFSKPKDLQWMYSIVFTEDCTYSHSPKSFNSPTEAYEAVIEYTLNNLMSV